MIRIYIYIVFLLGKIRRCDGRLVRYRKICICIYIYRLYEVYLIEENQYLTLPVANL